jgi:hypothetical protein
VTKLENCLSTKHPKNERPKDRIYVSPSNGAGLPSQTYYLHLNQNMPNIMVACDLLETRLKWI